MLQAIAKARRVLAGIEGSNIERRALRRLCERDVVTWMRLGMWSRRIKKVDPDTGVTYLPPADQKIVPFIPWPQQVHVARELVRCVRKGDDAAVAKARETGVSTVVAGVAWWGWAYQGWDGLFLARVEADVDQIGDPDTLMAKLDAITEHVPAPLLPPGSREDYLHGGRCRKHLMLMHPSGQAIIGEATTGHAGRGKRKAFAAFDEAAAQDRFVAGWRAATDTVASKWAISTHLVGSHFTSTLWPQAKRTGKPAPLEIHYHDDPDKGAHAVEKVDEDGAVTGEVGRVYVSTPWFERERKARDLHDLRENVLALPGTSGRNYFPAVAIANMRALVSPARRCIMRRGKLYDSSAGAWRVWRQPDSTTQCVLFADPSYGTGAANGCIAVFDADARELLAMMVDPTRVPFDISRTMVGAARGWCRGRNDALIGWETNGPGESMGKDMKRLRYTRVYRQRQRGNAYDARTKRVGWRSDRGAKKALFGDLLRHMLERTATIRDEESIRELEATVVYDDGGIGPAGLEKDVSSGAREAHGDRCVAIAGGLMLCEEAAGSPDIRSPGAGIDYSAKTVLGMERTPDGGWVPR